MLRVILRAWILITASATSASLPVGEHFGILKGDRRPIPALSSVSMLEASLGSLGKANMPLFYFFLSFLSFLCFDFCVSFVEFSQKFLLLPLFSALA